MDQAEVLPSVVVLLFAAIFIVVIFKRLKLSPVLGYLVAGTLIGDYGLKLVEYDQIHVLAEYGVVFLLFAIGLELSFERLKAISKYIFGLGTLQVFITAVIIAGSVIVLNGHGNTSVLIGGGLALSSTAVVMQVIAENRSQSTQVGRISFAILLLQDFAVVPLLVIVPLLNNGNLSSLPGAITIACVKASIALALIFLFGRLFLRPIFSSTLISESEASSNELFVATTLLIALAAAFSTEYMGLSLALGAFVAGVLVAETEFQHKAEESISPFKGLLLGLFFMSVGMTIDMKEIYQKLDQILLFTFSLIALKTLIIAGLCILFGFSSGVAIHSGLLLSQGGEFAFILFKLGMSSQIIGEDIGKTLLLIVTFSMALTPLLSVIGGKIADYLDKDEVKTPNSLIEQGTRDINNHVIIAGFSRVGKMVARVLEAESINYIIIDLNEDVVKCEKDNGFPIFKGDISQLNTLVASGASRSIAIVMALKNQVTIKKTLKVLAKQYPSLVNIIRAPDLSNSDELYDLGATIIVPQDYELGLQLGGTVLKSAGIGEYEVARIKEQFRAGNYVMAKQDEDVPDEHEN